jgi:glycosyltransferase involved in cell wall biosynthesis
MQLKNKKILYLYSGGHEIHLKFAKQITHDVLQITNKNIPKDYYAYFLEGKYPLLILKRMIGKVSKKSKIISLFANPRLFYMKNNYFYDNKDKKIKRYPFLKKIVYKKLLKKIDGALCVGTFIANILREMNSKVKIKVVYPFIEEKRYQKLQKIKPNLNSENILFIGNGPDPYVKGLNLLIKSFNLLKEEFKDSKLYILGEWPKEIVEKLKSERVFFEGPQKNIEKYFKNSSLYVHVGIGDTFPTTVLESFLAGIPAIVSNQTGIKEIVKKLDKNLISNINSKNISDKIKNYLKLP